MKNEYGPNIHLVPGTAFSLISTLGTLTGYFWVLAYVLPPCLSVSVPAGE